MELVSKQFALSGRLKPEARLGLAISEFAQSLDDERRKEFRRMQAAGSTQISGRDVIKVTEEINQEGARRHRSWRPHGTKVGGFLSRIQNFASIGDVLIGGSQNLIATGVWSAVRLSLTIATNYLNYFEKLSTLFMRLGTSWALHEDFAQLFPQSQELQTYFCEYLVVLMRLCNKVVVFGQKNLGSQLLSSLGSSFDSEFGAAQKELDQWGCLIQQNSQLLATKMATGAEKGRYHDLKQRVLRQLSPCQNDFVTRWRRQRKKGTCEWIFDAPSFEDWKSMGTSATLCISGKLGSGKTVSMANIVSRLNLDQSCAYAFCTSQESSSLKATNILGSIAFNLLDNLAAESTAWNMCEQISTRVGTLDPDSIVDFMLKLLPEERKLFIVADGLEDCSDANVADVIDGLKRLMQSRVVLLCYSSRYDSVFHLMAKKHMPSQFSISLDNLKHDEEIEAYITEEITRRNIARHLSPEIEDLVKKTLIAGAQGMYLWASLQLDTIFPADSKVIVTDNQILNLITHLPKDLPEAFERALEGIIDPRYEDRMMKLVMSAVTPLSLGEIRVALCVILGEPVWHIGNIAKDGAQLMSLCGGNLLDIDEEDGKVRFIHHSVITHLLSPAASQSTIPYHFTIEDAENFTGATCITYIHLPILDSWMTVTRNLQGEDVLENVTHTTRQSLPVVSRLFQHIRSREQKRARPSQVDIGHIVTQIQAARMQDDHLDPRCFAHYATNYWVFHTRFFDQENQDCRKSWGLWWRLLYGGVATVKPPYPNLATEPFPALLWAVEQAHGSLFRNLVTETSLRPRQIVEVIHALNIHKSIHDQWLGDILAQYLHVQNFNTREIRSTADTITLLLDLGANPNTSHHVSQAKPIDMLAYNFCPNDLSDDQDPELMRVILAHPTVQKHLKDWDCPGTLETLHYMRGHRAVATIIEFRPDMKVEFEQFRAAL